MKSILLFVFVLLCIQLPAQVHNVTLRPHFSAGKDTYLCMLDSTCGGGSIFQHIIDSNLSKEQECGIMSWTNSGCPIDTRTVLRFSDISNTSVIPSSATITSAILTLYGEPSSPNGNPQGNSTYPGSPYNTFGMDSGWVYELSDSFNVSTVTWRNQPGIKHADSVLLPPSTMQWGENAVLNVTTMVNDMRLHGNTGFLVKLQNEYPYRCRLLGSSKATDTALHPSLQITYTTVGISNTQENTYTISTFPNPVHDQLSFNIYATVNTQMVIKIYDMSGRIIYNDIRPFKEGNNTFSLSAKSWVPGMYIIEISSDEVRYTQKFNKLSQ